MSDKKQDSKTEKEKRTDKFVWIAGDVDIVKPGKGDKRRRNNGQ